MEKKAAGWHALATQTGGGGHLHWGQVSHGSCEENRLFLDDAAGAGRAWGSLEQRGLH